MKYLRLLLLPISCVYGLVVIIRNLLYDWGVYKSQAFELPVISVGNLDVGGAGKTPMTEYLIRLLKDQYQLATLSRGYGRQTKGFVMASEKSTAAQIGDEPGQMKAKFPGISVAVCEDRVAGINKLKADHNLILMDDAYQHRAVKPGFSILLFDYNRLQEPQFLLPAGNRREPFWGRKRADIIVISKCPDDLASTERDRIKKKMKLFPGQQLFFTSIAYYPFKTRLAGNPGLPVDADTTVFLLTGIANPKPLLAHLSSITQKLIHHHYPDHHRFSLKNIAKLADEFNACPSQKKVIVTTEKDAQRLGEQELVPLIDPLPVLIAPIGIEFLDNGKEQFDQLITNYVRKY